MRAFEAFLARKEIKKQRLEKQKELMKEYDREVFVPSLQQIQTQCDHDGQHIGILFASKTYCQIKCHGCEKVLFEGNLEDIPKELRYKWSEH